MALVAMGGAFGSVLRWLLTAWTQQSPPSSSLPFGTLLVNVLGSFAIGALMTLSSERMSLSPELRLLLVTGVLGGFTTFSAYSYETLALMRSGQGSAAALYVFGSAALGIAAAFAGRAMAVRA
ncbi:MAG: fluoride efflux transporter CrcB [Candidatus Eisenbacteria bacterium]